MAAVTLGDLVLRARQRADQVNSAFKDDSDLRRVLLTAAARLRQRIHTGGQEFERLSAEMDTIPGQWLYEMPADFSRLMALMANEGEVQQAGLIALPPAGTWSPASSDATGWVPLWPFELAELPMLLNEPHGDAHNVRYRLRGQHETREGAVFLRQIELRPTPRVAFTLRLEYLPLTSSVNSDSTLVEGLDGYEEIVVLEGAIYLLESEESDARHLHRQLERHERMLDEMSAGHDMHRPERVVDVYAQQHHDTIGPGPWRRGRGFGGWP